MKVIAKITIVCLNVKRAIVFEFITHYINIAIIDNRLCKYYKVPHADVMRLGVVATSLSHMK